MESLINRTKINKVIGRTNAGIFARADVLDEALAECGIPVVGKSQGGDPLWYQSQVEKTKDKINKAIGTIEAARSVAAAAPQIVVEAPPEHHTPAAIEKSLRDAVGSLQRYIDTSFSQFDDQIAKVLNCGQQSVRLCGDIRNSQTIIAKAQDAMTVTVSQAVVDLRKKVEASLQMNEREIKLRMSELAEEVSLLRIAVNEAIKRCK